MAARGGCSIRSWARWPRSRGSAGGRLIQVLGEALDRVAAGGPAIVLMEGEAGIGKTRLLGQVLEDAASRGMQVATGRAEELERTRPFGVLAATLGCARSSPDPQRAAIAALLADPGAGDLGPITVTSDPGLRFRVVDALTDLVEELALAGPLVIGLDDLQWADPSSLLTLGVLARRLADLPVGLIGCLRPFPRVAELDQLTGALEATGARHLVLHPLPGHAVTGLVAQAVAAEPGPRLLAEVAGAAGNPLFVTELLGALAQEEAITTAGGQAEVTQTALPPTLRLTILRRVSFLPEPTLQALRSASGVLQAAVDACARGPRPLQLALTCEDAAAAFARRDNVARVGQLLDQATTIYERLGAARDLARAEAALRQLGIRRGRRVPHRREQSGWQSLTPSERAVVDLVAEGLSNPQIGQRLYVSRRTVQTHLGHVFAKLHITSRTQLAAEAARHSE